MKFTESFYAAKAKALKNSKPEQFMACAVEASKSSPDLHTKVGAVIVNSKNEIIGAGYNREPEKWKGPFEWRKRVNGQKIDQFDHKKYYNIHAELSAISDSKCGDLSGCTIYQTLFPCNECAKLLIELNIEKIVYLADAPLKKGNDKIQFRTSRILLKKCEAKYEKFKVPESQTEFFDENQFFESD